MTKTESIMRREIAELTQELIDTRNALVINQRALADTVATLTLVEAELSGVEADKRRNGE